ncbi:MAG TPA: hypothetical protein VMT20_16410 [Terriglobia bacterium]|nr:hypothetical protein [Terriglobia bacterium]
MAEINLTQDEADKLMAMEKCAVDQKEWLFPAPGERIAIPLSSLDKRESFMLDVTRAQIKLTKATFQNRARVAIILMRLDLDGRPHTNPDGEEIPCPHPPHLPGRLRRQVGNPRPSYQIPQYVGPVLSVRSLHARLQDYGPT